MTEEIKSVDEETKTEDTENITEVPKPVRWNYTALLISFIITVFFQTLLLPCLCDDGSVKSLLAFWVDILVFTRIMIAGMRKESNNDWKFYVVFLLTSPIWIIMLVEFLKSFS